MVLHTVDYPDGTSHLDKLLVHVVVNRFLFVQVDVEVAVFGGPNSVDPDSNVGVGHGGLFGQSYFLLFGSPNNLSYKLLAGYAWGLVADNTPFPWVETHGHTLVETQTKTYWQPWLNLIAEDHGHGLVEAQNDIDHNSLLVVIYSFLLKNKARLYQFQPLKKSRPNNQHIDK